MARTLTIYQGEDQTPASDITEMVEWPDCEFGQRAYLGESTGSELRFRDVDGVTGNAQNLPVGLTSLSLAAHNVVKWTEGSNTMFRGRVSPKDYSRGEQVVGRAREVRIALDDYNKDLHNIVVHSWTRGAETDAARVQALVAAYLSGSPRATTNLNGSNFVITGSNTIALPAQTYTRTNVLEVLTSIASAANKTFFVTIDSELFYAGNDYAGYNCPYRISDRDTEQDGVFTFAPIWDVGPASREDGQQLLSGIWLFYGESQYVYVNDPVIASEYSWWEDIVYDDTVTTAAQATVLANAILARRKTEERIYNVSIGPLSRAQWGSIKHGQLIQIKARAIPDADDQFVTRRIVELRWTPSSDPETLFAHMTLDRPIKVNPYGPGQKVDTITPNPAPQCLPPSGGIGAPVGNDLFCPVGSVETNCGPVTGSDVCWSGSSESFTSYGNVSPGTYYSELQVTTKYGGYADTVFRAQIRDTITSNPNLSVELGRALLVQCRQGGNWVTLGGAFTVPTGYNQVRFGLLSPGGKAVLEASHTFNAYTPPAASDDDPNCFDYDGQNLPSESPHWLPSDTVEAMVAAAAEPHGFLAHDLTNKSGTDRLAGDLVIVDTANDASFTTTTTANLATRDFGILQEDIANNAVGSVLLRGFSANVNLGGATPTRGHYLFSTTTAGRGATSATRAVGAVGQIVEAAADGAVLFWGNPDGSAGGTLVVQEDDTTVEASATTLDFTTALNVTSSPAGEANIAVDLGTGATQAAAGNHTHTAGDSAKASATSDLAPTTTTAADVTGATLSLGAGTYIVIGNFQVEINSGDRVFEGVLDVGGVDENDLAIWEAVGADDGDDNQVVQVWRVVLGSTTTVKLQARHSGGTTGDFDVKAANTTITAFVAGSGLGAWQNYTPAWTSTGTAPAIGNGTLNAYYKLFDANSMQLMVLFVRGSTSTNGTGDYMWSLPSGYKGFTGMGQSISAYILDSGTAQLSGTAYISSGSTTMKVLSAGGNAGTGDNIMTNTRPMTLATGDAVEITGVFRYEVV